MKNLAKIKKPGKYYGKLSWLIVFILCIGCDVRKENMNHFRVGFYNVENYFDTLDDPLKNDNEFLPNGKNKWDSEKFTTKSQKLARVIDAFSPSLLGLAEIENEKVLRYLVENTSLEKLGFDFIHFDSPDPRGIDVALLYRKADFKPVNTSAIQVKDLTTRDILYVEGEIKGWEQKIHLFVTHFPSRLGGREKSEKNRLVVAKLISARINSILEDDPEASIIVMGDFNDEPIDKSIAEVLKASTNPEENLRLYNTSYQLMQEGFGSYMYRDQWDMLDQLIISAALLDDQGLEYAKGSFEVFSESWMLQNTGKYQGYPSRTYAGNNYLGGISDHLPVFLDLVFTTKEAGL